MITIILIIEAAIILLLKQIGIIKGQLIVFLIVAIITGISAFILKNKISCPFSRICPFGICPLNKPR